MGFVLGDTVADAASKDDDVEGPVGVACSATTELELAREIEDDVEGPVGVACSASTGLELARDVEDDVAVDATSELDIED